MKPFRNLLLAALALLPFALPFDQAHAAASTQTTHAWLCRPPAPGVGPLGGRVVDTASTASPQPAYILNNFGCALFANADIGFFLSQGFYYGPNVFTTQTIGITSSGTTSVSTLLTLPAYGYIVGIVLCETSGNAVTGGLNVGDAGSATRFGAGATVPLAANGCTAVPDAGDAHLFITGGVPTADIILLAAVTSWNSALVNVTVLYSYY